MEVTNSILNTIKKMIGIMPEDTNFDVDIIALINMELNILTQLGIGPEEGFRITSSDEEWEDFVGDDPRFEMVKTCVFLKVKILFDSSQMSSSLLECYKENLKELEWRLNVQVDPVDTFD